MSDIHELGYERSLPPRDKQAKLSLKIGIPALAMLAAVWAIEAFVPANADYIEYVGLIFVFLLMTGVVLSVLGVIVAWSALATHRDRHTLAIVGLLFNVVTLSLHGWFFYTGLRDD